MALPLHPSIHPFFISIFFSIGLRHRNFINRISYDNCIFGGGEHTSQSPLKRFIILIIIFLLNERIRQKREFLSTASVLRIRVTRRNTIELPCLCVWTGPAEQREKMISDVTKKHIKKFLFLFHKHSMRCAQCFWYFSSLVAFFCFLFFFCQLFCSAGSKN